MPSHSHRFARQFIAEASRGLAFTAAFSVLTLLSEPAFSLPGRTAITAKAKVDPRIPGAVAHALLSHPKANAAKINDTALMLHRDYPYALDALNNSVMAAAFIGRPEELGAALVRLNERAGNGAKEAFSVLKEDWAATIFVQNPNAVARIALGAGAKTASALAEMKDQTLGRLFKLHPWEMVRIAVNAGADTPEVFRLLKDPGVVPAFAKYPEVTIGIYSLDKKERDRLHNIIVSGGADFGFIVDAISLHQKVATELGSTLDNIEIPSSLRVRVSALPKEEVVGLICSNASNFSGVVNRLLLKRFKAMAAEANGPAQIQRDNNLNGLQMRNLALRAYMHRQLDALLSPKNTKADQSDLTAIVLGAKKDGTGIYSQSYDPDYYRVLADGASYAASLLPDFVQLLQEEASKSKDKQVASALQYVSAVIGADNLAEPVRYNPDYYRGPDRKIAAVQVFDRMDTEGYFWNQSVNLFKNLYGAPRISVSNSGTEAVFEDRDTRMILFMGNDRSSNTGFISSWITKNAAGIIVFRGDQIHLASDFPSDIFGNRAGKYVLILGSCRSASVSSEYTLSNPKTDIRTVTYLFTGIGEATNQIALSFLEEKNPAHFGQILEKNSSRISKSGGNPELLKVWSPGDGLQRYVAKKTEAQQ